jgi:hypothetical protein
MSGPKFTLYRDLPGIVLGFHGCDAAVGEKVLSGQESHLVPSDNKYDWLGGGIYFWENDPLRALEFAEDGKKKPKHAKGYVENPFVIGAVIDLGFCLNLLSREACDEATVAFDTLIATISKSGEAMPENKGRDMGARFRDRAVIETIHQTRLILNQVEDGTFPKYDSVRAAFLEGQDLYEGSGFAAKNHVQLAIRNMSCIKGYFRPFTD